MAVHYTNWGSNQPDNNLNNKDCKQLGNGNGWNDAPCSYTYNGIICNRPNNIFS